MSELAIGIIGMASLFVLLGFRIPVAFAMFVVGFLGIAAMRGFNVALNYLASEPFTLGASAELVGVKPVEGPA